MKRSKCKAFVIFALPEPLSSKGARHYYSDDATITDIKSKAAQFLTHKDAEDFANKHGIELTPARYIGLETFD